MVGMLIAHGTQLILLGCNFLIQWLASGSTSRRKHLPSGAVMRKSVSRDSGGKQQVAGAY